MKPGKEREGKEKYNSYGYDLGRRRFMVKRKNFLLRIQPDFKRIIPYLS
ncbi:MAG: hypothetical protein JXJ04_14875 [Spirochaetales bacterium]|nr:hypothetical protein [Spirochaetales bacterium]